MKNIFKLLILLSFTLILSSCLNNNESEGYDIIDDVKETENTEIKTMSTETNINNEETTENKKPVNQIIKKVGAQEFKSEIAKGDGMLIDLRTLEELRDAGMIEGALNIDYYSSDFKENIGSMDKSEKYLIYCRSGNRSSESLKLMEELGFENVLELNGGINAWIRSGGDILKVEKIVK